MYWLIMYMYPLYHLSPSLHLLIIPLFTSLPLFSFLFFLSPQVYPRNFRTNGISSSNLIPLMTREGSILSKMNYNLEISRERQREDLKIKMLWQIKILYNQHKFL